jgi:hypothetical protein
VNSADRGTPAEAPAPQPTTPRRGPGLRWWVAAALLLAAAASAFVLVSRLLQWRPQLTADEAAELATATLQRESREAFVITGVLDITVHTQVTNVRRLFPGLLDLSVGTVESTVRAPGRVSYGFRVDALSRESFSVHGDTIEMDVPPVQVYSVEPALDAMEVSTTAGWLRVRESTPAEVQQRATALVTDALRRQAEQHLGSSEQPGIHTARTVAELLRPAFQAHGIREPVFLFRIANGLSYTSDVRSRRR